MEDTTRLPRPPFDRRRGGPVGRVEHDDRGNAVWVASRATDTPDALLQGGQGLAIAPAARTRVSGGRVVATGAPYYEYRGPADATGINRRPTDLRALSRWLSHKPGSGGRSDT